MTNAMLDLNQDASTYLVSNTTRLTAPVDPVPVLNPSVEENNEAPRKCNHFSIRGYVLEVRNRDPTLGYPFTQQASTNLANELPPMEIPNCGWCQCSDSVAEAAKNLQKNSHGTGHDNEAQNIKSADDPAQYIAAIIQNYEANPTDSNHNRYQQVSDINPDRKGKGKAHVEDELPLTSGFDDGILNEVRAQWILPQTKGTIDLNQSADYEVVYNGIGTPEALYKFYIVDHGEAGSSKGYGNPEKDHTAENHGGVPQTSSIGNQGADPPANGEVAAIVGIGGPGNRSEGLNLPDLNECISEPCFEETRETIVTETPINNFCNGQPFFEENPIVTETPINSFCNGEPSLEETPIETETPINGEHSPEETPINSFCKDDDVSLGAERQKKRKLKLLSDFLGLKRGQGPSKGKKKTPSSASSKDDVSIEEISEAVAKRRCNAARDPLPKKRSKKTKVDHGDSSSLPQEIIIRRSLRVKGKSTEEPTPKRDLSDQLRLRNSVPTKKRGKNCKARKMLKEVTEDVNLFPSSLLSKGKEKMYSPLRKDRSYLPAESMLNDGDMIQKEKENGNIIESLALRTPAVGPLFTGNQSDGRISIGPVSESNEKRAEVPAAEERLMHNGASHPFSGTYGTQNGASRSYAPPVLPSMHNPFLSMQNPPFIDPRSSINEGYMGHLNPIGVHGLPQGRLLAARLLTPSQVEDLSHPYSIYEFTIRNWNNEFPPSFLQAVDKYQKDRVTAPRHTNAEAPRFWPPITTSRMPISGNILNSGTSSVMQGNSAHPCYPSVVPTVHSYTVQFENDVSKLGKGIAGATSPLTMQSSHFATQNGEPQESLRRSVAARDKGKAVASEPKPPNTNKAKHVPKASSSKNTSPAADNMICELNQNPGEINDPNLMSQYAIGLEELKRTKKARDKASGSRGDAPRPVARASKPKSSGKGREKQRS